MRKILTVLVLLVCLTTAILAVGCSADVKTLTFDSVAKCEYTGSFTGNGADWIDAIAATDSDVTFTYAKGEYFSMIKAAYKGVTIENEGTSYLVYYTTVSDPKIANLAVDPFIYDGDKYYSTTATIDQIPVSAGFKVLFVQLVTSGTWGQADYKSEVGTSKAVLFSYVGA